MSSKVTPINRKPPNSLPEARIPLRFELSLRSALTLLGIVAGIWLLTYIYPALVVLLIALMLVGALAPLVTWLESRRVHRVFAVCTVFGFGVVLTATFVALTVPTIVEEVKSLTENESTLREHLALYLDQSPLTSSLAAEVRHLQYVELAKALKTTLLNMGTGLFAIAAYSAAAISLAFYIMIDRDRLRGALFAVVPRTHHLRLSRILLNLVVIVGGYIRGQLLTCALMGVAVFTVLSACRVPNALALAVFGGTMDLLPYIGIFLTMGPAVLAASVNGPLAAGIVFGVLLAYEELESRVLLPVIYGRALRLPSSVVFFALLVGTTLAGIIGALLALPVAAAVLMLIDELKVELPGETIRPEDVAQQREEARTEQEYERRTENLPAEQAAAVAVEISNDRRKEERIGEKATEEPSDSESRSSPAAT